MTSLFSRRWALALSFIGAMCLCLPVVYAADHANTSANSVSAQDQRFINKAWDINKSEIRLGKIAEKRADSADVKAFGKRMVTDHSKLNNELISLAKENGATLPKQLEKADRDLIEKLSKLSGSDFDRQYMDAMITGHRQAVDAFENESKDAAQTTTDKWAGQAVVILKEHLELAEKTGKEVGAPAASSEGNAIPAGQKQPGSQQKSSTSGK